jgi:hypothetical protein
MRRHSKKIAIAIGAATVVFASGAAYTFWTAGGTGTGTGTVGTNSPITVNQTSVITGLAPGVAAQVLSGNFTNTNAGPVHVATVTVTVASTSAGAGCTAADFTIVGGVMTVNADIPAGSATGTWTGATIVFNSTAANQDACKLATVNLAYVAA